MIYLWRGKRLDELSLDEVEEAAEELHHYVRLGFIPINEYFDRLQILQKRKELLNECNRVNVRSGSDSYTVDVRISISIVRQGQ